jgi:hypothetical protein
MAKVIEMPKGMKKGSDLPEAPDQIKAQILLGYEQFENTMYSALKHGLELGSLLNQKKEMLAHGDFLPWITANLPFSVKTAQNFMRLDNHRAELEEKRIDRLTDAYQYLIVEKPAIAEDPEDIGGEVEVIDEPDESIYWYWPELQELIKKMNKAQSSLAKKRNNTTPKMLAWMIGNIRQMSGRLESWAPSEVQTCPQCEGKPDLIAACPYCINGTVGLSIENPF